jgi:RNA-binding protein YhbY
MDLSKTIIPKSDQLNADDLISGPKTIKIREIKSGADDAQPVNIYFYGDNNKPFKPCKSVRRILVQLWGADSLQYIGRRITLFRDDKVKWAGIEIGGIRISHASHIEKATRVLVTTAKNSRTPMTIDVLPLVVLKDFEAAKLALKENKTTVEKLKIYYDLTNEQLKALKDETV